MEKSILDGIPITYLNANCPYCINPDEKALPVVRKVLEEMHCPDPECACTVLELAPECHPEAGQRAFYCKIHGTLALFCAECNGLQSILGIAAKPHRTPRAVEHESA